MLASVCHQLALATIGTSRERREINPTFRVLLKLERGPAIPLSELLAKYEELHHGS